MKSVLSLSQCAALVRALLGGMSVAGAARCVGVRAPLVRAFVLRLGEGCRALSNIYLRHLDVLSVRCGALAVRGQRGQKTQGRLFFAQAAAMKLMLGFRLSSSESDDIHQLTDLLAEVRSRLSVVPFIRNKNLQGCEDAVRNVYGNDFEEGIVIPIRPEPEETQPAQKPSKWENKLSRLLAGRAVKCGTAFLEALAAVWMCFFNFCVRQKSTRCTPAEGLSIVSKPWSPEEMIAIALRARAAERAASQGHKRKTRSGSARKTDTGIWLMALPDPKDESASNAIELGSAAAPPLPGEQGRIVDLAGYRKARVRASAKPPVKASEARRRWEQLALFESDH